MSFDIRDFSLKKNREYSYSRRIDVPPRIPTQYDDEFEGSILDPKWTIVGQTTGQTVTVENGRCCLFSPVGVKKEILGIFEAPPSGNWEFTEKISMEGLAWNYMGAFISARVADTKKQLNVGVMAHSGFGMWTGYVQRRTDLTQNSEIDLCNFSGNELYFRMKYDGTNLIFSMSASGTKFVEMHMETVANHLGVVPDLVGFSMQPYDDTGYGWGGLISCEWFRRTA